MPRYILRRLIATIPILLMLTFLVFGMLYVAPGDPAALIAGDTATPADIEAIRERMGLHRPFLEQFFAWVGGILQGDIGTSVYSGTPVAEMISQRALPTASLMGMTILISVVVSVPLGVMAAAFKGHTADRIIMVISVIGFSVPVFIVGYVLAYGLAIKLPIFPVQGYVSPDQDFGGFLRSLVLPSMALSFSYIALITRVTRSTLVEILSQDYVRTARAKGVSRGRILFWHALRNAAVQISTVIGVGIAVLLGGSVIIETVFSIPGIGSLVVSAIVARDFPVIQGVLLVVSLVYVLVNLLIDLLYPVFDPRISY